MSKDYFQTPIMDGELLSVITRMSNCSRDLLETYFFHINSCGNAPGDWLNAYDSQWPHLYAPNGRYMVVYTVRQLTAVHIIEHVVSPSFYWGSTSEMKSDCLLIFRIS